MGDFILTLPVIAALQAQFAVVHALVNRKFRTLLDQSVRAPSALDDPDVAPFFARAQSLPEDWSAFFQEHDLVISYLHDAENILKCNIQRWGAARFVEGPYRIRAGKHATEQLAAPLRALGIPILDFAPAIAAAAVSAGEADVALHPGSGSRTKNWPIGNWLRLIERLQEKGVRVLIVGGEADAPEISAIRSRFGDGIDYAIDFPLAELATCLSRTLFLGHDSGVSHLAAATGARTLVLFGPTDPEIWAPRNKNARMLVAAQGNLARLEFETVWNALAQELMRIGIRT